MAELARLGGAAPPVRDMCVLGAQGTSLTGVTRDDKEPPVPDIRLQELVSSAPCDKPASGLSDAIVVEQLAKRYPNGTDAVRGISFSVRSGEVFGILGPNGAGKSTTMGMLGTLVRPTGGRATVAGYDVVTHPREVRRRIGFAMQEVGVDEFATGSELVVLHGRLHGLSRHEAARRASLLLDLVGVGDAADRRMGEYSGGMRRRVDLASALVHLPPVLFLDEPTEGLDPHGRTAIWETLERLNQAVGMTIVLTTHYMEEADRLCGRIAIVDRGQLVAEGTPDELKAAADSVTLEDVYLHTTGRALGVAA
jgi:ABC-2 type transport system ATP-binding protein